MDGGLVGEATDRGVAVIRGALTSEEIANARRAVEANLHLLRNTRTTPSAGHLAGFDRYPALEPLHHLLTGNERVRRHAAALCGRDAHTIGLSDITINRSQPWHKDLLRGRFAVHLGVDDPCRRWHGTVYKFLAYLQPSASLQVVVGSHWQDIPLTDDSEAIPDEGAEVRAIPVQAGDVVVLDICATHRGADESAYCGSEAFEDSKILVSTVFGNPDSPLTGLLETGNAIRLAAWTDRCRSLPPPVLRGPGPEGLDDPTK
jgi:hypothetical protein